MTKILQDDDTFKDTKNAFALACTALGYPEPTREAEEVIDLLGVTEDGKRGARLAPFYSESMTTLVDRAARLARLYPEALLEETHIELLDLLVRTVQP